MNKLLLLLSVLMGVVVLSSNFLVQFPIKYYNLENILTYGAFTYPIAFLVAQLFDVKIFDQLRKKKWFVAPLTSSFIGSIVDTFLFFSISFYGTGIPWVTLSFGDLAVKIFVALTMLIPFRLLLGTFKTA